MTTGTIQVSDKWEAGYLQAKGHIGADRIDERTDRVVFDFNAERPRRQIVGQDALNLLRVQIGQIKNEDLRKKSIERLSALEAQLKEVAPIEMSAHDDLREFDIHGLVVAKTFKQECQSIQNRIRKRNFDNNRLPITKTAITT